MPSPQIERKLAAIMFTDIVGSTAQMSKDEAVAISLLNKKESVLKPLIAKHNGTYVKSTGDGSLSHFNSAVDAATCAKRFQESIYDDKDLNVRVGVHLGDTIFEKGDIRGDGVNIASRLESMAVEGGVFVSKEVHDQLANQKEFEGISLGLQSMKGVGRLIEVYGLKGDLLTEPKPSDYQDNKIDRHSDDEVPSIAIIPFRNKGKEEDAFYAYGICADLISDCSSAGLIRVASLERVEELSDLLIEERAEKLDVRYIATGNLWKMDDMFQLSVELYDTKESKIIWSDRWEEEWDNLHSIKGSISDGLLKALTIKHKLETKAEIINVAAYKYYLKAKFEFANRKTLEGTEIAQGFLMKAIELDDKLLIAKIILGQTYWTTDNFEKAKEIYNQNLEQAEVLNDKKVIADSLNSIGMVYQYREKNYEKALNCYFRALTIYKNIGNMDGIGISYNSIGSVYVGINKYDEAIDYQTRALNIHKELGDNFAIAFSLNWFGNTFTGMGLYDKALSYYKQSLEIYNKQIETKRGTSFTLGNLGWLLSKQGKYNKAIKYLNRSIMMFEELGETSAMLFYLHCRGKIHYNKNEYDKAVYCFEKRQLCDTQISLRNKTYLYLTYKQLGKKYNETEIKTLIQETKSTNYDFEIHYSIYQLLEDTSYLETAYNQVQEKASAMDDGAKFLSYPIPKAIVEEWNKVK